jgi:hypothetical protein
MFRLKRTVTPASLAANRRAALKSTTTRGKSRSFLNALRTGRRSKTIDLLWQIMAERPLFGVIEMARRMMIPTLSPPGHFHAEPVPGQRRHYDRTRSGRHSVSDGPSLWEEAKHKGEGRKKSCREKKAVEA